MSCVTYCTYEEGSKTMRNKKAVKALKEIAKQEGVQLETIREEIALAIRLG